MNDKTSQNAKRHGPITGRGDKSEAAKNASPKEPTDEEFWGGTIKPGTSKLEDIYRKALTKIKDMKPSEIAPETYPGLVHGPALLLSNCQRVAREALKGKFYD